MLADDAVAALFGLEMDAPVAAIQKVERGETKKARRRPKDITAERGRCKEGARQRRTRSEMGRRQGPEARSATNVVPLPIGRAFLGRRPDDRVGVMNYNVASITQAFTLGPGVARGFSERRRTLEAPQRDRKFIGPVRPHLRRCG